MKTNCCMCALARQAVAGGRRQERNSLTWRSRFTCCAAWGLCGLVLLAGCATHQTTRSKPYGGLDLAEPQASPFGTIAVGDGPGPASFSFQKAKGKLGSATEAIVDSAELGLGGPGAGIIVTGCMLSEVTEDCPADPVAVVAIAGAVGGVTAIGAALVGPLVGAKELVRSLKRVSPEELAEREAALESALRDMAGPQSFREALIQIGAQRIRGGFVLPPTNGTAADVVLNAGVDELRLERAGAGEGSYFLRIKTHARLLRANDGVLVFAQNAEYRSGTALFLDWTLQGALQGVAETGFQALARYYVDQLLGGSPERARLKVAAK